jgi:hypothetical protein
MVPELTLRLLGWAATRTTEAIVDRITDRIALKIKTRVIATVRYRDLRAWKSVVRTKTTPCDPTFSQRRSTASFNFSMGIPRSAPRTRLRKCLSAAGDSWPFIKRIPGNKTPGMPLVRTSISKLPSLSTKQIIPFANRYFGSPTVLRVASSIEMSVRHVAS